MSVADSLIPKEWKEYYERFRYFKGNVVRDHCFPALFTTGQKEPNAIVLVHGLTDSPYFMRAIGRHFHRLGFNVVMPLLQGHGLREPKGMQGVSLAEWRENVAFALATGRRLGDRVSIGGLSTGGTLSIDAALHPLENAVDGAVFLFSAALDLARDIGDSKSFLLLTPVGLLLDFVDDRYAPGLLGDNPYRYSRMDKGGARQLAHLMEDVEDLTGRLGEKDPIRQPLFIAHSEADTTADIRGVMELYQKCEAAKRDFFRIGKAFGVPHASVALNEVICAANGSPLEPANPFFDEMMNTAEAFARRHLST